MTEETAAATTETAETAAATTETTENGNGKQAQTVPYDRFKEVNERAKAAEDQLAELTKWKDEQEAAKLSDIEKAEQKRQQAEERATQAEQKALKLERSGFVRSAAAGARFTDPDDAVAFLEGKLGDLDTPEKAKEAVAALAKTKPHLVGTRAGGGDGGARGGTLDDIPRTPDGKVDVARGLGQDLLQALGGQRGSR